MRKLIETFICADEKGNQYTIERYHTKVPAGTLSNPNGTLDGLDSYTWKSTPVQLTGNDTFYISNIKTEVRKVG